MTARVSWRAAPSPAACAPRSRPAFAPPPAESSALTSSTAGHLTRSCSKSSPARAAGACVWAGRRRRLTWEWTLPDEIELLKELVAIPSVSGTEDTIAEFVEQTARSWGLEVERDHTSVRV